VEAEEAKREKPSAPHIPLLRREAVAWQRKPRAEATAAATVWHRARGLDAAVRTEVSFFPDFSKPAETSKFKTDAFRCSKNSQTLHEARMEYSEKLHKLC
jgi:hypothetical protein